MKAITKRPTFERFREKALANLKVRAEYDAQSAEFVTKHRMIVMRKAAQAGETIRVDRVGDKLVLRTE